jgi:hypothetical protein
MSASTRTNRASPPASSIVSGDVTSSRVRLGRVRRTACLAVRDRLAFGCSFGFARCAGRRTGAADVGAGCGVKTGAGGGVTTTGWGEGAAGGG